MDATNSFFPMDLGSVPMQTDGTNGIPTTAPQGQSHSPQQNNPNANAFTRDGDVNGGVFMGVSEALGSSRLFDMVTDNM